MSKTPKIVTKDDHKSSLSVAGTKVIPLAKADETNGQEFTYQSGEEGTGPPPHSHAWDESFFVIRGSVEVTAGGETVVCEAGTFAYVPGGTIHTFRYGPGGGEILEIAGEKSQAVQLFTDLSEDVTTGAPDIEKTAAVLARNGATLHL